MEEEDDYMYDIINAGEVDLDYLGISEEQINTVVQSLGMTMQEFRRLPQ